MVAAIVLVLVLAFGALWLTVQPIDDLIQGDATTNSASDLLAAGSTVWLANIIAFALLYWELDWGGAEVRVYETRAVNVFT